MTMSNVFKLSISAYILICCRVRRKIQTGEYDISEDFFLTCLYPRGIGNPEDVELGFLRSGLLVKVAFPFSSTSETNTYQPSDFLCSFYIPIILRSIRPARIRRGTKSKGNENDFTEESHEK